MTREQTESQGPAAIRWTIREGRKISPTAANVLTMLLSFIDMETGICYPKRRTIASDLYDTTSPSKAQLNTISALLTRLVNAGLLTREQAYVNGRLSTNVYILNVGQEAQSVPTNAGRWQPSNTGHREPTSTGHREPSNTGHLEVSKEVSKEVSSRSAGAKRHLKAVDG